jgi:hypothetical protein
VPSTVDRDISTSTPRVPPGGVVLIAAHTIKVELLSAINAVLGIANAAAAKWSEGRY